MIFFGICLLTASFTALGFGLSHRILENRRTRKAFQSLLHYIQNGIENGNRPLNELCRSFSCPLPSKHPLSEALNSGEPHLFSAAVKASLAYLPRETVPLYTDLGKHLGTGAFRETELTRLRRCINDLDLAETSIYEKESVRLLLYRKLGILAGLAVSLAVL